MLIRLLELSKLFILLYLHKLVLKLYDALHGTVGKLKSAGFYLNLLKVNVLFVCFLMCLVAFSRTKCCDSA